VDLSRGEWSVLRDRTPPPLTIEEMERLRGLGDVIDLDEVRDVHLSLSRLVNLYVGASSLRGVLNTFLGDAVTAEARSPAPPSSSASSAAPPSASPRRTPKARRRNPLPVRRSGAVHRPGGVGAFAAIVRPCCIYAC
jgi:pantothenate kinase